MLPFLQLIKITTQNYEVQIHNNNRNNEIIVNDEPITDEPIIDGHINDDLVKQLFTENKDFKHVQFKAFLPPEVGCPSSSIPTVALALIEGLHLCLSVEELH